MAYGPPVVKQCVHCKTEYKCLNHMANKSRFCSVDCHNLNQSFIKTEYTCAHCNDKFMARPDHGAPRKFCSRKCFLANGIQPAEKECENCGGIFTATRSSTATRGDGRRLYCSKKCYVEGARRFQEKPCVTCGELFYPVSREREATQLTCSTKCKAEFFSGVNAPGFRGGKHIPEQSNHRMVLIGKRGGYVSKYTAEHRLLIAKYFGRMLTRNEVVLHINNNGLDNRLSNLYLCESMSEYGKRRSGSLPWPKTSNLKDYKEKLNESTT